MMRPVVQPGSTLESALNKRAKAAPSGVTELTEEEFAAIKQYDEACAPLRRVFTDQEKDRRMHALGIAARIVDSEMYRESPPEHRRTLWTMADYLLAYAERGEKPEPPK